MRRKSLVLSTAALIGLVALALIAFDAWRTWQDYDDRLAVAAKDADNLAHSLAEHAGGAIEAVDTTLVDLRQRLETSVPSAAQTARLYDTMRAQVTHSRSAHAFFIIAADGAIRASTAAVPEQPINATGRDFLDWWRGHTDDRPYIGGPYRNKTEGVWIISISRRFNNPDGSFGGVVAGSITLDYFKDYYKTFDIGEGGALLLIRDDGTIMVRQPSGESFFNRKVGDQAMLQDMMAGAGAGSFVTTSRVDAVDRLGSFRKVPLYPLFVVAALDRGKVLAEWRGAARAHAAGAIFMAAVIVLLGLRLTVKIIDDARLTDERLRRSEKMEVIGRLAAGVAHDFNNILQVIMGGMEILRDEAALSPAGKVFVDEVESAARRGASLTHHLLSYSGKQVLSPRLLDVPSILEKLHLVLSRTLRSNIAVTMTTAPGVGMVRADPNLLQTALINLAINAAHAMRDGGSLRFEARVADQPLFGELSPGRHVVLAVTDTGTGMSEEVTRHAFDPFFTTKGVAGSGLGLPMVQGFSRQSGGDVRIITAPGRGTSVEIWLPETVAAHQPPVPAPIAGGSTGRVLLVDDSQEVLFTIGGFLRSSGFLVRQAANGYQALALLGDEEFDLLVTDYMMPGFDGIALVRQVRTFQPGLPALIISGYAAMEPPADLPDTAYLCKPFQRDQLLEQAGALIAAARQRTARQPVLPGDHGAAGLQAAGVQGDGVQGDGVQADGVQGDGLQRVRS